MSGTSLSPLGIIAQYESANGTQLQNPYSTASGDWQMVNATWQEALTAVGGNPSEYPTAISAPVSLQAQAAAYEFNTYGWAPWSSNAQLMAAVQAAGGQGAFAAPGTLATDGASYAALDGGTDPLSFFGGASGGGSGLTVTATGTGPAGTTSPAAAASPSAGATFLPFSWIWNQYQTAVQGTLTTETGYVLQMAAQPLGMFLLLDLAIVGSLIAVGINNFNHLWRRLFKILIVLALVGTANVYQSDFVAVVTALPTWLGQSLTGATANPAGNFDNVFWSFWNYVDVAWQQVPWGTEMFIAAGLIGLAAIIVLGAELVMFVAWFSAQVITGLLLVIGPLIVLALLSEYLSSMFVKYVQHLLAMVLFIFLADVMAAVVLQIMLAALQSISTSSTALAMVQGIVGVAVAIFAIGATIAVLFKIVQHLAGSAVAPSMASVGAAVKAAGMGVLAALGAGAAAAGRAGQATVQRAYPPSQPFTPPGRSMSSAPAGGSLLPAPAALPRLLPPARLLPPPVAAAEE